MNVDMLMIAKNIQYSTTKWLLFYYMGYDFKPLRISLLYWSKISNKTSVKFPTFKQKKVKKEVDD